MSPPRDSSRWTVFNAAQRGRAVRPLLAQVLALAGEGRGRRAIDLGCGAGVETLALLEAGWTVHALDNDQASLAQLRQDTAGKSQHALNIQVADLNDLPGLPEADLIYAGYALPFTRPAQFESMWATVLRSLRPGGWLAVNMFGDRDSWSDNLEHTFLTEMDARALFAGLDVERFDVQDEDGVAFSGPKHWHVFSVIARRPHDQRQAGYPRAPVGVEPNDPR
jgi:trans-aconitate methyltransferase